MESRRNFFRQSASLGIASVFASSALSGCSQAGEAAKVDLIWGERGLGPGRLLKPRAIAIDDKDRLFIVDMTGRIQIFSADGEYESVINTPKVENGKPCGLGFASDGSLMVADTHYFRVLFFTPDGEMLTKRTIGGKQGTGPGEFGFVTDAVEAPDGSYYVSEYGEFDRIQHFSPDAEFIEQFGGHGEEPGKFMRPQALLIDRQAQLWVADACNHRVQVFDLNDMAAGPVKVIGKQGTDLGTFRYIYGLVLDETGDPENSRLLTCEFGNHRIQELTLEGEPVQAIGRAGRGEGEFHQPWSMAMDSQGRLHVLDSYNHRVQRLVI